MEIGEVIYEKVYASPRIFPKISLKHDRMKELGSEVCRQPDGEVAQQSKSSQSSQPNPKPDHERTEKPVVFGLWIKPQTKVFHEFVFGVLCYVAIGSFTADGGPLQQTESVKTTPQKTFFRSVNLYKEFACRSKLSKWLQRQESK